MTGESPAAKRIEVSVVKTSLRQAARREPDAFRFIRRRQRPDPRRGLTRVRELARLWHRVHERDHAVTGSPAGPWARLSSPVKRLAELWQTLKARNRASR